MWKFQVPFQNNKGFTLIEFILGITLTTILLITIFSLFNYSNRILERSDNMDRIILNGRFGLEYIRDEVLIADKIISSYKFKDLNLMYPTNIGFVIMKEKKKSDGEISYDFITYYRKNDELMRIACENFTGNYPSQGNFKGFNQICTNLTLLENTNINIDNKVLNLQLNMGLNDESIMEFKSTIYLRCLIDF